MIGLNRQWDKIESCVLFVFNASQSKSAIHSSWIHDWLRPSIPSPILKVQPSFLNYATGFQNFDPFQRQSRKCLLPTLLLAVVLIKLIDSIQIAFLNYHIMQLFDSQSELVTLFSIMYRSSVRHDKYVVRFSASLYFKSGTSCA